MKHPIEPLEGVTMEKSGTYPLMKYILRGHHGHYSVIVIDDKSGDVFINAGGDKCFHHWWGGQGRGTKKLREFLCSASVSYFKDKFSYGRNTWYAETAMENLKEMLCKEIGDEHTWSEDLVEEVEGLDGNFNTSEGFYHMLGNCPEVQKVIDTHGDPPSGEEGCSRDVHYFIERCWAHFVAYWKQELIEEAAKEATNATASL